MSNKIAILLLVLFMAGCSTDQHSGHIYRHGPDHWEARFDRPMSMKYKKGDEEFEASSLTPGFFTDLLKFMLLRPR